MGIKKRRQFSSVARGLCFPGIAALLLLLRKGGKMLSFEPSRMDFRSRGGKGSHAGVNANVVHVFGIWCEENVFPIESGWS